MRPVLYDSRFLYPLADPCSFFLGCQGIYLFGRYEFHLSLKPPPPSADENSHLTTTVAAPLRSLKLLTLLPSPLANRLRLAKECLPKRPFGTLRSASPRPSNRPLDLAALVGRQS